jgi:hypothetical protein
VQTAFSSGDPTDGGESQPGDEGASVAFFLIVIVVLGFVIARLARSGLPRDPKDGPS